MFCDTCTDGTFAPIENNYARVGLTLFAHDPPGYVTPPVNKQQCNGEGWYMYVICTVHGRCDQIDQAVVKIVRAFWIFCIFSFDLRNLGIFAKFRSAQTEHEPFLRILCPLWPIGSVDCIRVHLCDDSGCDCNPNQERDVFNSIVHHEMSLFGWRSSRVASRVPLVPRASVAASGTASSGSPARWKARRQWLC